MAQRRAWLFGLAAAAAALAGCEKPQPKTAKAPIQGAFDVAPPAPKAGLWVISTTGKTAAQTTRLCIDQASAARLGPGAEPAAGKRCPVRTWSRRADGALVFTSVCDLGEQGLREATAVMTGDLARAYRMAVTETTTGAVARAANGTRAFSLAAEWRGPCPAGWTGGDVGLEKGVRFNLLNGK
jgi:hypothetical protein